MGSMHPVRPDWVQRVNDEGRHLDLKGVVPLDERSLLEHAKRTTGLSDFGADDWYEPFKVFIKGLEEEAQLNLVGRLMTRADLLMHLEARLRVEDLYKRHPEIDSEEISRPLIIVGSGRSGTSAMHNLLIRDPDNGAPLQWEVMYPVPVPETATYGTDTRIARAERHITFGYRVAPELESMHEYGGMVPTELNYFETLSFQGSARLTLYGVSPTFQAYAGNLGHSPKLRYAKRILKVLQWKNPRKRWILKSPDVLNFLPEFFDVFPDADMIWMHRDPLKAMSSFVSLVSTLVWIRSDKPLDPRIYAHLTDPSGLAGMMNHAMDLLDRGTVPVSQIQHIRYTDFIADPLATATGLYRNLGAELTASAAAAMRRYLNDNPRERRPAHRYSTGAERHISRERQLFERYQRKFDIPSES